MQALYQAEPRPVFLLWQDDEHFLPSIARSDLEKTKKLVRISRADDSRICGYLNVLAPKRLQNGLEILKLPES
jgi:hypothetical protein